MLQTIVLLAKPKRSSLYGEGLFSAFFYGEKEGRDLACDILLTIRKRRSIKESTPETAAALAKHQWIKGNLQIPLRILKSLKNKKCIPYARFADPFN
jgi:hypothetical protein